MHWQESEILDMPVYRRRWYVERLREQKEYEAEAMKSSNKS